MWLILLLVKDFADNAVQHKGEEFSTHPLASERYVCIIILSWTANVLESFPHSMILFTSQENLRIHELCSSWMKPTKVLTGI